MEWIETSDKLPQIGEDVVILFVDDNGEELTKRASLIILTGFARWRVYNHNEKQYINVNKVSHWVPLDYALDYIKRSAEMDRQHFLEHGGFE